MDCKKCKDKPYYPKNKCCFNCGKDADKCRNTHFCSEDCKEWVEGKTNQNYEWIGVNDRLPDREGSYLVCINHCGEIRMQVMKLLKWANGFDWDVGLTSWWEDFNTITHWMPLPEEPKPQ